jgi:hypothetical protein
MRRGQVNNTKPLILKTLQRERERERERELCE